MTNLAKLFFPETGLTKSGLLQYYADVAPVLLPHVRDRPMVMKRYPNGASGDFFFMKRTPAGAPDWLRTCRVEHGSGNTIDFPVIDDLAALLWVINLGCIDLNPWYAHCDDVDRPDVLHFDLDPVKDGARGATPFARVREAALAVRDGLAEIDIPSYAKTTGSNGIHVYVPIERGPVQKEVWRFAKAFAQALAPRHPDATHRRIPGRQTPARPSLDRLQPERMGPNARVRLLGATHAARDRLGAGHVGGTRGRRRDRRLSRRQHARADCESRRLVGAARH